MSLEVEYKGTQIAQLTQDGSLTLDTAGTWCEDDIELTYSGGGERDYPVVGDGKTYLHIVVDDARLPLTLYFTQSVANAVTFDWGDGSEQSTSGASTSSQSLSHTYATEGEYTVAIDVLDGTIQYGGGEGGFMLSGNSARCTWLRALEIGSHGSPTIGMMAFINCHNLRSVKLPDNMTSVLNSSAFQGCISLAEIEIPSSVTEIGSNAFSSCSNLRSVDIPSSVTVIGQQAFSNCGSLESIELPPNLVGIYGSTFLQCYRLRTVTIPVSVASIGQYAFRRSGLEWAHLLRSTPPTGATGMFDNIPDGFAIYVPAESVAAYKAANYWKNYASQIQAEPA